MNEEMKELKDLNSTIKSLSSMKADTMGITGEDLLKVMELKNKLDEDPDYDFVAEVPKSVRNVLKVHVNTAGGNLTKKQEKDLLESLIFEIGSNGELQKELTEFRSEIKSAAEEVNTKIDEYVDGVHKSICERTEKAIENETDPEKKALLQAIHQSYLDSFEMTRLMDIIKERGKELDKVLSKEKFFKRGCQDIDYFISEKYHISTMEIMKGFERADKRGLLGDIDAHEAGKVIMAALIVYAKNLKSEDKPQIWFVYNSMRNILSFLYHSKANKYTDKTKEAILNLFSAYTDEHNQVG